MKQKTLFISSAVLLLVAFVSATLLYNTRKADQSVQAVQSNQSVLVRFHSPALGNPNARVHIVEFLDPACETCRSFYPFVKKLMADNPDKIRLSIRYAPFHQGSDEVVKVLEAARKQGKYWQSLEALLAAQSQWVQNHAAQPHLVWQPLEGLGLQLDQVRADMKAPDIARVVQQDLEDAKTLRVTKTPEFFVNGKPMPSFGYEQLKKLVDDALVEAYR
jgi:protein-disulfide isomerase